MALERGQRPTYSLKQIQQDQDSLTAKYIGNLTDDIPYSKQIILGLGSFNQKADVFVRNSTDKNGHVKLKLRALKAGTAYSLFVTYTTKTLYEPILYGTTSNITRIDFYTIENPNLKDYTKDYLWQELKEIDPKLYSIILARKHLEKRI